VFEGKFVEVHGFLFSCHSERSAVVRVAADVSRLILGQPTHVGGYKSHPWILRYAQNDKHEKIIFRYAEANRRFTLVRKPPVRRVGVERSACALTP